MCGRYSFVPSSDFGDRFLLSSPVNLKAHYNVTPGNIMPVITRHSPNSCEMMIWGLIPFWAKDMDIGYKMINARAESVATKPSFRKAFQSQRCIVPATGFFEWKEMKNEKIPYYIRFKNQKIFSFAGLYDIWKDKEGQEFKTYTIITTTPNPLLEKIHNRMPVILAQEDENIWLNPDTVTDHLTPLFNPYPADLMETYSVSKAVNKPMNDSAELIKKDV